MVSEQKTKFKDTEIGMIPEDWEEHTFGDFIDVLSGFAFKSSDFSNEKGIPIIKIKNITPPIVSFKEIQSYNKPIDAKVKKYILRKNDILISMTGSNVNQMASAVGKIARYNMDLPALLNQRVGKLIIKYKTIAGEDYIYLFVSRKEVQYYLAINASGSANQANISPDTIKSIKIVLPPLPKQNAIAKILSDLDSKIELLQKQNKTLEAIGQVLFKHWFVDFEFPNEEGKPYKSSGGEMVFNEELGKEIPKGWAVKPLDQIANFLNGLALQKFPPEGDDFLPVIKIKELRQGISEQSDKASPNIDKKYIINDGDVLFSWSGTLMVVIWGEGKGALNQHLFKVTSENFEKWFYYYWIKNHLRKFIGIAKDKTTTMGHIKRHHLTDSKVLVPNDVIFERMNEIMNSFTHKKIKNKLELRMLISLRDTLLPKLMSGEIRVNNLEAGIE